MALWLAASAPLAAQTPATPAGLPPSPKADTEQRLSPHVWVMRGFPNVVIVVGDKATLVVDTGLGPAVGQIVARTSAKLAKGPTLYLTTTHFHPEHAAGEGGFPSGTILVRPKVQEDELEADKGRMLGAGRPDDQHRVQGAIPGLDIPRPDQSGHQGLRGIATGAPNGLDIWRGVFPIRRHELPRSVDLRSGGDYRGEAPAQACGAQAAIDPTSPVKAAPSG